MTCVSAKNCTHPELLFFFVVSVASTKRSLELCFLEGVVGLSELTWGGVSLHCSTLQADGRVVAKAERAWPTDPLTGLPSLLCVAVHIL